MAQTPEAKVKAKIKALLKTYGSYYAQPIMRGMAHNGTPDILACSGGHFIGIEAKADGSKKPTPLQYLRLREIQSAGGIALVIHKDNLDVLESTLDAIACGREVPPQEQFPDNPTPAT